MKLPVVGPTYTLSARTFDGQRCVNLFPSPSESGSSKDIGRLVGTPGKELLAVAGGGPHRGTITTAKAPQRSFFVSGQDLYETDAGGITTYRGTLNTQTGRVSMDENGTQILIVDGTNGYIFTLSTNLLVQITDDAFPNGATTVTFMDTYFIVNDPDTGDFYISANYNGLSWSNLDKTTVESSPDNLLAVLADHGQLFVAGPDSIEVYQNTGNATFPFQRIPGAVMEMGIASPHTLQSFDNTVVWVSEDAKEGGRFVYKMNNSYRAERISTEALESQLASVDDISDAYICVYRQPGHEFLVLQVPGLSSTWVYDAATQMWHERTYFNAELSIEEIDRGSCYTSLAGMILVGDRENGNVYKLRSDYYTDNGQEIHRTRITPHLSDEMRNISHNMVHLDLETGVGQDSGIEPQVMMRFSDDGGRTWSHERWRGLGKIGQYKKRARWTRCGMARDRVYWFRITDPIPVSINGAFMSTDGEQME